MSDLKDIPSENATNFSQRARETLQTLIGTRGDKLDRAVRLRDLLASGLIALRPGAGVGVGTLPLVVGPGLTDSEIYSPDLTPPPEPDGFAVSAGISHVFLEHAAPTYTQGHGHLRTRVYGAIVTPALPMPVFSDAVEITQFSGTIHAHPSNPSTTWRLWIKWETRDNVLSPTPAGGTNGLLTKTGEDVSQLLEALTGQITQSELFSDLGDRINLIDGSGPGSVDARIANEAAARALSIQGEASARGLADGVIGSALQNEEAARQVSDSDLAKLASLLITSAGSSAAAIAYVQSVSATDDAALASQQQTLRAAVEGSAAAISVEQTARASADEASASIVTALVAQTSGSAAAIVSEQSSRADADSAAAARIDTVSAATGLAAAAIKTEQEVSTTADAALALQTAVLVASAGQSLAAIVAEQSARATSDSSQASQIVTLTASAAGNTAAISTEADVRAAETGELYAKYTVKTDVAGLVSGYGLASTANNAAPTSSFGVRASNFFVAPPSVASATAPTVDLYKGFVWLDTSVTPNVTRYWTGSAWTTTPQVFPFVIQTAPTTINGVTVPVGVYIEDAFIKNGTITNAKIGNAQIDDAKISDLSVDKLTAGSIAVGQHIQSTEYVAGSDGWRINGSGTAEFSGVVVRGTIYASAGLIGGSTIGSTYMRSNTYVLGESGWNFNSDGTGQVGGMTLLNNALQSNNFVAGSAGWRLRQDGFLEANAGVFRGDLNAGQFTTGAFTGYAWPSAGAGNIGTYLGPSGLLIGNANNGKYFQVEADGDIYAPGFSVVNGTLTISQANVITSLNIANQAVSVSASGAGSNSATTNLYVPPGVTATVFAFSVAAVSSGSTTAGAPAPVTHTLTIAGTGFTSTAVYAETGTNTLDAAIYRLMGSVVAGQVSISGEAFVTISTSRGGLASSMQIIAFARWK